MEIKLTIIAVVTILTMIGAGVLLIGGNVGKKNTAEPEISALDTNYYGATTLSVHDKNYKNSVSDFMKKNSIPTAAAKIGIGE